MTQAISRISISKDQQIVYSGISWAKFQLIRSGFAESPGIRLAYYDNTIDGPALHSGFRRIVGTLF